MDRELLKCTIPMCNLVWSINLKIISDKYTNQMKSQTKQLRYNIEIEQLRNNKTLKRNNNSMQIILTQNIKSIQL